MPPRVRVWYTKSKELFWVGGVAATSLLLFFWGTATRSAPLLLCAITAAFFAAQSVLGTYRRFTETNNDVAKRVQKLEQLIDHATTDIVIYAGSLFHRVYDHPAVLLAFRRAQKRGVFVTAYHNADLDNETVEFVALVKEAGWAVSKLTLPSDCEPIPHVVIVDRIHLREELESASDDAPNKLALIRYDVPKRAREFYDRVLHAAVADQMKREAAQSSLELNAEAPLAISGRGFAPVLESATTS